MNARERQFRLEIVALQGRVQQLAATFADSDRVMSSLAAQADAARAMSDGKEAARIGRKIDLMRHRRLAVTNEIGTLQKLIDVRRRLGGAAAPGF